MTQVSRVRALRDELRRFAEQPLATLDRVAARQGVQDALREVVRLDVSRFSPEQCFEVSGLCAEMSVSCEKLARQTGAEFS